ncbi:MAG: hypothetical protein QNJ63_17870 [Calothrix sp. MO_192.B10]|nr:hypothetical protein [Calothrix sp. MO_192.B10]
MASLNYAIAICRSITTCVLGHTITKINAALLCDFTDNTEPVIP